MRWATFHTSTGDRAGALVDDSTLLALPSGQSLLQHLREGTLDAAADQITTGAGDQFGLNDVRLLAPIPRPPSIRDALCYLDHMRRVNLAVHGTDELDDVWYTTPAFYFGGPASVVGPHDDVALAPGSTLFDFELEIAAVIGGTGDSDLTVTAARDVIAGYTIYCDWSARDLQIVDSALGIGQAKGKDAATTLGPYLVTPDELAGTTVDGHPHLDVTARVNGRVIGRGNTGTADWLYPEIISYVSRGIPLTPGDVIGFGTIPSCTLVEHMTESDFPGWLTPGDTVSLEVDHLGITTQTVTAARAHPTPLPRRR